MGKLGMYAASVAPQKGFKVALGNGVSAAAGTTVVITTTAAIAIGDLVVVRVAADNLSATTPTFTCADSGGVNSYTAHAFRGNNATAAAGIVGGILATKATAAVASGGTITVTMASVTAKAAYAESFIGFNNTLRNAVVVASGASTAATVTSGSATAGDLVIGCVAAETRAAPTFDTDTTNGSWSTGVSIINAAGSTDASRVEVNGQYKVVTGTGTQTYDNTITSTDWAALIAVFQAA